MPEKSPPNVDMFDMLTSSGEKAKKKRREELLASTGTKEFFAEGNISVNKRTCWGVECKLCIKACPTNALYWKAGEIGIVEDLCVYCSACVLSCMVDDCMKVTRKREDGKTERFSKPKDVRTLQNSINTKKRLQRVSEVFPTTESYLERYEPRKKEKAKA